MIGFDEKNYEVGDSVELHSDVRNGIGRKLDYVYVTDETNPQHAVSLTNPRDAPIRGVVRRTTFEVYVELEAIPGRLFIGSPRMFRGIGPAPEWDQVEELTWIKK
jgi:hypothetical protein